MHGLITDILGKWTLARFKAPVPASSVQREAQGSNNLLCFDLYDLSCRSSGLVSRPLCDLSLSPCITGRKACWPIRPRFKTCQGIEHRGIKITKNVSLNEIIIPYKHNSVNMLTALFTTLPFFFSLSLHTTAQEIITLNSLDQQLFY